MINLWETSILLKNWKVKYNLLTKIGSEDADESIIKNINHLELIKVNISGQRFFKLRMLRKIEKITMKNWKIKNSEEIVNNFSKLFKKLVSVNLSNIEWKGEEAQPLLGFVDSAQKFSLIFEDIPGSYRKSGI